MINRSSGIRVLFSGHYWPGSDTIHIANAFENFGVILYFLNEAGLSPQWHDIKFRILRRFFYLIIEYEWNRQILRLVETFKPHLIYVSSGRLCWKSTLEIIRNKSIPTICFYHDVVWKNQSQNRFSEVIKQFDLISTTRRWQVEEFIKAGAKDVMLVRFGFDPTIHRQIDISELVLDYYAADISFIGTREYKRELDLKKLLVTEFPYSFKLWGNYWDRLSRNSILLKYWQGRSVLEQEIPIIYAASKVGLHWVGWDPEGSDPMMKKGDQHNPRSFQIPACGGAIMIAQRTEEHQELFEENKEAVYFDNVVELKEKLDYWLDSKQEFARRKMAFAARQRCLSEDYTYLPVVKQYLEYFGIPFG